MVQFPALRPCAADIAAAAAAQHPSSARVPLVTQGRLGEAKLGIIKGAGCQPRFAWELALLKSKG
jgi:hypothetical protein